jgi:uncharacterized protein YgbK (DUF1537 family)
VRRVVLADDLTGAGDAGVQFAKAGLRTTVWLDHGAPFEAGDGDVVVVDMDSRAIAPDAAYARMRDVLSRLPPDGPYDVIKKIDSTLRGNAGPELRALLEAYTSAFAIVCPAYPKNGRTVRDGVLMVDGVPVDRTDFGRDLFSPVRDARVGARLGAPAAAFGLKLVRDSTDALDAAIDRARSDGLRIAVADAETDDDLRAVAALQGRRRDLLWVGSAGLIEMLDGPPPAYEPRAASVVTVAGPVVFLIGSIGAMTRRQVDAFARHAAASSEHIEPVAALESRLEAPIARSCAAVREGRDALVALGGGREDVERALEWGRARGWDAQRTGRALRERLVEATRPLVAAAARGAIVLSGGDVARTFCERHGVRGLTLIAEAAPGIPVSRSIGGDLLLVTKAGGFGGPETYRDILETLHPQVNA